MGTGADRGEVAWETPLGWAGGPSADPLGRSVDGAGGWGGGSGQRGLSRTGLEKPLKVGRHLRTGTSHLTVFKLINRLNHFFPLNFKETLYR